MRSLKLAIYAVCLATSLNLALAQDKKAKKEALTEEQQKLRKDLLAKYDTNKDGKLDKNERKNVSSEDKAKLKKAGLTETKKKKKNTDATTTDKSTNAPKTDAPVKTQ
ncbi:MAG TPA: hypothetical protein VGR78_12280 [Verrucomicrobiae bacterium]|jgi:hypothetical protein|nr:hypothetical protein [Verrucomicrobiae bacterium]